MMLIVTLCIAVPNINVTEIRAIVYGLIIYNSFISWARIMLLICVELSKNWSCYRSSIFVLASYQLARLNTDVFFQGWLRGEKERKREIFIRACSYRWGGKTQMRVVSKLDGCSDSTRRSYRAVKFNNRHKVTRLILLRKKRTGARWLANFRSVRLSLACTVKMSTRRIATCGNQYCSPLIFF